MTFASPGRARLLGLALVVSALAPLDLAAQAAPSAGEPITPPAEAQGPEGEAPPVAADDPSAAPSEAEAGASTDDSSAGPGSQRGRDAVSQLEAGSGVRVKLICTNCNAASLSVNGLSGEHVGVSMDGLPTVSGLGTVYAISQYPSDFIAYTHVTHGPGSVLSGAAAIGGTIQLHSIEPTSERRAFLDLGVADDALRSFKLGGAQRWGPVGALVWAQVASQQNVDANGDSWQEIGEFERLTAEGRFDFHLTDRQVLTVGITSYGEDQVQGPGGPEFEPRSRQYTKKDESAFFNWQTYSLRYRWQRDDGFSLRFAGRYSRRQQQQWTLATLSSTDETWTFRIDDEQGGARIETELPVGRGMLRSGVARSHLNLQVKQKFVVPTSIGPAPFFIIDNLDQDEIWSEYSRSIGSKWDFSAGVRGDRFTVYGRTVADVGFPPVRQKATDPHVRYDRFEPRAQAHFRPSEKLILGFAVGRGAQGPAPAFSETCCGARYQRSLQLRPQDAWSYQASVELHPTPDQRISIRLFRTDFDDYQIKAVYRSDAYIAYYTRKNVPHARVQGIDFVHDMRFKDDMFNFGWTWTLVDSSMSDVYATTDRNEILLEQRGSPPGPYLVSRKGAEVPFTPKSAGSAYFRYQSRRRGTSASFNWTYQGVLKHFELFRYRERDEAWSYLKSDPYWTADLEVEQRIGHKGWSAVGGVRNINDYVQADLGDINRIYDWGPLQGRTAFGGMKFVH